MNSPRRGVLERGTSVLAALVFVAVLSAIAYGVHSIIPSDPLAHSASAHLALGPGDVASSESSDQAKPPVNGSVRCVSPLKDEQSGKSASESFADDASKNLCVRGCIYRVSVTDGQTKIDAEDRCERSDGSINENCVSVYACDVLQCDSLGKCARVGSAGSASLEGYLAEKAGVLNIKESPDLQKLLECSKRGDCAPGQIESLSPELEAAFKKEQERAVAENQQKIASNIDLIRDLGESDPATREKLEAETARLQQENQNLSRVSSAVSGAQSEITPGCNFGLTTDGECLSASPDRVPTEGPNVRQEHTFGTGTDTARPENQPSFSKEVAYNKLSCTEGTCTVYPRGVAEYGQLLKQGYSCEADFGGTVCTRAEEGASARKDTPNSPRMATEWTAPIGEVDVTQSPQQPAKQATNNHPEVSVPDEGDTSATRPPMPCNPNIEHCNTQADGTQPPSQGGQESNVTTPNKEMPCNPNIENCNTQADGTQPPSQGGQGSSPTIPNKEMPCNPNIENCNTQVDGTQPPSQNRQITGPVSRLERNAFLDANGVYAGQTTNLSTIPPQLRPDQFVVSRETDKQYLERFGYSCSSSTAVRNQYLCNKQSAGGGTATGRAATGGGGGNGTGTGTGTGGGVRTFAEDPRETQRLTQDIFKGLIQGLTLGMLFNQAQNPYGYGGYGNYPYQQPMNQTTPPPQCPQAPPQPPASACQGSWQQETTPGPNGLTCVTGWKCNVIDTKTTAQISCAPLVADAGMEVSVSYTCANAVKSAGTNFSTNGALSGSAKAVLPQNASSSVYNVACTNAKNETATASCTVQVARPAIVLVANPASVAAGQKSTVGWVTTGMHSCIVSSPDSSAFTNANVGNTATAGSAQTPPLASQMRIVLSCETVGGSMRSATTTVTVQ